MRKLYETFKNLQIQKRTETFRGNTVHSTYVFASSIADELDLNLHRKFITTDDKSEDFFYYVKKLSLQKELNTNRTQ